jgi:hypothetical protein
MYQMNPEAMATIQPELLSGESIVWTGQPNPRVVFHKDDAMLIPFSLLWGGFAIFWEMGVMGLGPFGSDAGRQWTFGVIWGVPFVLVGQYLIWGRFLYAFWKKSRVYYALTNRRAIAVQRAPSRKIVSAYIDALPMLMKSVRSDGIGTVTFTQAEPLWSRRRGWGAWDPMRIGDVPAFVDINDANEVYRLVADLRDQARSAKHF